MFIIFPKPHPHDSTLGDLPRCVWARESTAPAQGNQSLSRELRASQGNLLISGVGNYMYSRPSCSYSPSTASSWPPDTRGPHFQVPNGEGLFCDLLENRCSPRAKREVLLGEEKGFCSSVGKTSLPFETYCRTGGQPIALSQWPTVINPGGELFQLCSRRPCTLTPWSTQRHTRRQAQSKDG